jgi:hypothetical protein
MEVLVNFIFFTVCNTPDTGDGVGRGTVSWWGTGGSRREDEVVPSSHSFRIHWSARDRIESEVLHALTSWESSKDLVLKQEEVFVNEMVEVAPEASELSTQSD